MIKAATIYPPIGLAYLAAALRQHGGEVEILDYVVEEYTPERLKQEVAKKSPDLVGIRNFQDSNPSNAPAFLYRRQTGLDLPIQTEHRGDFILCKSLKAYLMWKFVNMKVNKKSGIVS